MTPNNEPDPSSFRGFLKSLKDGNSEFREAMRYWIDCAKQIFRDFIDEQTREKLSVFTFPDRSLAVNFSKEVAAAINADPLCEFSAEPALPQKMSRLDEYFAPCITVTKSGVRPVTGAIVVSHNAFQPCGISVDGGVMRIAFTMPQVKQPAVADVCRSCGQTVKINS